MKNLRTASVLLLVKRTQISKHYLKKLIIFYLICYLGYAWIWPVQVQPSPESFPYHTCPSRPLPCGYGAPRTSSCWAVTTSTSALLSRPTSVKGTPWLAGVNRSCCRRVGAGHPRHGHGVTAAHGLHRRRLRGLHSRSWFVTSPQLDHFTT